MKALTSPEVKSFLASLGDEDARSIKFALKEIVISDDFVDLPPGQTCLEVIGSRFYTCYRTVQGALWCLSLGYLSELDMKTRAWLQTYACVDELDGGYMAQDEATGALTYIAGLAQKSNDSMPISDCNTYRSYEAALSNDLVVRSLKQAVCLHGVKYNIGSFLVPWARRR